MNRQTKPTKRTQADTRQYVILICMALSLLGMLACNSSAYEGFPCEYSRFEFYGRVEDYTSGMPVTDAQIDIVNIPEQVEIKCEGFIPIGDLHLKTDENGQFHIPEQPVAVYDRVEITITAPKCSTYQETGSYDGLLYPREQTFFLGCYARRH